jgi:hypothetical protein
MMKKGSRFESDEEDKQHDLVDAEDNNGERQKPDREKHFAEVEAGRRTDVEVEIGVVNVVKPPEERDHMIGVVPPPIGVVHEQIRGDNSNPARRLQPVQQTNMAILRPDADCQRDRQHEETDDRESGNGKNEIANEPAQHSEMLASQWNTPLQPKQREKNAAE